MIDFPASPTNGQVFSAPNGVVYTYSSTYSSWLASTVGSSGKLLQTVSFETGAVATGTTTIPYDDTIPQITEGDQYMTLSITPQSATSKLIIEVVWNGTNNIGAASNMVVALFQDSTANALAATGWYFAGGNTAANVNFTHVMTSGTTSATTFRVRAGNQSAGTTVFNGSSGGTRILGGVYASSIVITEVLP